MFKLRRMDQLNQDFNVKQVQNYHQSGYHFNSKEKFHYGNAWSHWTRSLSLCMWPTFSILSKPAWHHISFSYSHYWTFRSDTGICAIFHVWVMTSEVLSKGMDIFELVTSENVERLRQLFLSFMISNDLNLLSRFHI